MNGQAALQSAATATPAAVARAGDELRDLGKRAREFAEARPYLSVFSALAAGYVLARVAARIR